ncbi:TylF/MycF/NovP-related O-methyltransferase [Hansschlegelia beijingensis]
MTDAANRLGHPTGAEVMNRLKKRRTPTVFSQSDKFKAQRAAALYYSMAEITLPGDFAEFGVFKGESARFMNSFLFGGRRMHLFDSFEGLPEDWVGRWKKGHFDVGGKIPEFDPTHVSIYKGWFKDTVPAFAQDLSTPLSFIHMDADLYSSTMDVFNNLNDKIAPGTVILFDEYVFKGSEDEHNALLDWAEAYGREFDYLWRSRWVQVAIRVTK